MSLTPSQQMALDLINSDGNVFLTGAAGTGKSFVIKEFLKNHDPKVFPVLASTGAAAVLIGGRTFHSFFGIGIMEGGVDATIERALKDRRVVRRLKNINGFILDEVSMLSGPVIEAAERIASMARQNPLYPWGGLKVIAVGDFAQLPPVERGRGQKSWAFLSPVWKRTQFQPFMLEQNLRSENVDFLKVLQKIRVGDVDEDVSDFLHSRVQELPETENITRLYPRRNQTQSFNEKRLKDLEGDVVELKSEYHGPQKFIDRLKKTSPIEEIIRLKINCLLMLRQNDPRMRWVNGSTGVLEDIKEDGLRVRLLSNDRLVTVDKVSFSMLDAEGKVVAAVTNYPVSLAYAATIHKAQGMTLDRVQVDLRSLWEPGQAYVAVSRVTHPNGLYLTGWDNGSIKSDLTVSRFYDYISQKTNQQCTPVET